MFEIYADEVTYDGKRVATLTLPPSTLREKVESRLRDSLPADVLEDNLRERYDDGYGEGRTRGMRDVADYVSNNLAEALREVLSLIDQGKRGAIRARKLEKIINQWDSYVENLNS